LGRESLPREYERPMTIKTGFFAYPAEPTAVGTTIEEAVSRMGQVSSRIEVETWRQLDIPGQFIAQEVCNAIETANFLVADVSRLNFNVTYEIAYAIGLGKPIYLVRNRAIGGPIEPIRKLGLFDTIGWEQYQNSQELAHLLRQAADSEPIAVPAHPNHKTPVFMIDASLKTDPFVRMISRLNKARLSYRVFDPNEQPRLSANEAIRQVAQSFGVLLQLQPSLVEDSTNHNLRVSFVAGLAHGMGKVCTILQQDDDPVPMDYRDLVFAFYHPNAIDEAIADFAARTTEVLQEGFDVRIQCPESFLSRISFGASSAENESKDLAAYYIETDAYRRASRGEARLVVGRKGSGKSAIFFRIRDKVKKNPRNVVLDLKPEGYQLLKFKEAVVELLEEGSFEHTIMAFWEYVLLLEICHKLLESDRSAHLRDHYLFEDYRQLEEVYRSDDYISEGDFSERISRIIERISSDFAAKYSGKSGVRLSTPEVTEVLYQHDFRALYDLVNSYLAKKDALWLLFDNIDKGWPTHGVKAEDLVIIRTLLEATRKLERQMRRHDVDAHTIVFLRNDIYELLVEETPDRGKESKVLLDWTDRDMLRELLRRRIVFNDLDEASNFETIWPLVCVSHIEGEDSADYLIDRCLMRPRYLLDLVGHCRGFAVNLKHTKIEREDLAKGIKAYSGDLLSEIGLEIRDVAPNAEDVLYAFIGSPQLMSEDRLETVLKEYGVPEEDMPKVIDVLLWYGFLGVQGEDTAPTYIYDVTYNFKILKGLLRKLRSAGLIFCVNPGFWSGLQIQLAE
jgi:hypothetical protein